jgi:hypothetical protein
LTVSNKKLVSRDVPEFIDGRTNGWLAEGKPLRSLLLASFFIDGFKDGQKIEVKSPQIDIFQPGRMNSCVRITHLFPRLENHKVLKVSKE